MRNPEAQLQRAVASYLSLVLPDKVMWSAIGHGGGGKIRGAQLKAMGLRRGLADFYIAWKIYNPILTNMSLKGTPLFADDYAQRTLWIELKSKDGRQSDEQKQFQTCVTNIGHSYTVCRSIDEVVNAIILNAVPTKARRAA